MSDGVVQERWDDLDGRYAGVVDEYQLGVAAFVKAVASAHAPCCCVLGIGYEAEFDFCDFEFPCTALDGHSVSIFLVLPSYAVVQRLSGIWHEQEVYLTLLWLIDKSPCVRLVLRGLDGAE